MAKKMMISSVHRHLALRLLLVALVIALLVSLIVVVRSRDDVGQVAVDRAIEATVAYNDQVRDILDQGPDFNLLQQELVFFARGRDDNLLRYLRRKVRSVYATILDSELLERGVVSDGSYEHHDAVKLYLQRNPAARGVWYQVVSIADTPHILVMAPLKSRDGEVRAYLRGVYMLTPEARQEISTRMQRSMLLVIAIVLVTTACIYPIVLRLIKRVVSMSLSLLDSHLDTLRVLGSAVAKRDSDTDAHNYRVTIMAVRIAETMGLENREMRSLIKGAFLHDVGKIGIPDEILLKPGKLDDAEFAIMKTHVDNGLEIISSSSWLLDAMEVVASHHEKADCSGYPLGLCRQTTPLTARIFAVADVFDALTSKRPYKESFSLERAISILEEGRGSHFDPEVLEHFMRVKDQLYTLGELDDAALKARLAAITRRYFLDDVGDMIL